MQLKVSSHKDIVFQWISYNQFNSIKEISKGDYAAIYSAIWEDASHYFPRIAVVLKCVHNSQNNTDEFLNEVCNFSFTNLTYFFNTITYYLTLIC